MTAIDPGQQAGGSQPTPQQAPAPQIPQVDGNGQLAWNGQTYVPMERYAGLQGKVQQQVNELTDWKAKFTTVSTEAEGKAAELQNQLQTTAQQRDQLQTTLQELQGKQTEFQTTIQQLQVKQEATQMVMTEFPELAPEFAQGFYAIDGKSGDELRNFLKGIQSTRHNLIQQSAANFNQGATPPPPPGGGQPAPSSATQLQEKLDQLSREGKTSTPEYQTTYNEWFAAVTQK